MPIPEDQHSDRYWAYVVGANVRRLRLTRDMTISELSSTLCDRGCVLSAAAISMMERNAVSVGRQRGHIQVTVDRLLSLSNALGVHHLELLREDTL